MLSIDIPQNDRIILKQCVIAAVDGPFFEDYVFPSLFPQNRDALRSAADEIERAGEITHSACTAITSTLNNLLGYPHNKNDSLSAWTSVSVSEIRRLADRWFSLLPPPEYQSLKVYGPTYYQDKYYRVVEFTTLTGHGHCSQVWDGSRWTSCIGGPGCPQIMESPAVTQDKLLAASVDVSDLPVGYDPLSTEHQ